MQKINAKKDFQIEYELRKVKLLKTANLMWK